MTPLPITLVTRNYAYVQPLASGDVRPEGIELNLIRTWDALPRVDQTIPFDIQPDTWYRLKLTTAIEGDKGTIKGKAWPRDAKEPAEWLTLHDPRPNTEGAPALYGYVKGIVEGEPGTDVFYGNVRITPNISK